jgi:hypothetical protein
MSRVPHEPTKETRSQVTALASVGTRQEAIADYLDVDEKTLRKYYAEELRTAGIKANTAVAQALFTQATKEGNVAAQIFWLKTKAGWSEKLLLGIGQDQDAGPLEIKVIYGSQADNAESE